MTDLHIFFYVYPSPPKMLSPFPPICLCCLSAPSSKVPNTCTLYIVHGLYPGIWFKQTRAMEEFCIRSPREREMTRIYLCCNISWKFHDLDFYIIHYKCTWGYRLDHISVYTLFFWGGWFFQFWQISIKNIDTAVLIHW